MRSSQLKSKTKIRSRKQLANFIKHCEEHPQERFWQALRNWSGWPFIYVSENAPYENVVELTDTFYWEGKNKT